MKTGLCGFVVVLLAAAAAAEDMKTVTISHQGAAVMTLSAPQSAKVTTENEKTVIDTKACGSCPRPRRWPTRSPEWTT
jgi:hypothetical protein